MTARARSLATCAVWAVAVAVYAYVYVSSRISLPGAEGYERLWSWQLFFFAIARLPLLGDERPHDDLPSVPPDGRRSCGRAGRLSVPSPPPTAASRRERADLVAAVRPRCVLQNGPFARSVSYLPARLPSRDRPCCAGFS